MGNFFVFSLSDPMSFKKISKPLAYIRYPDSPPSFVYLYFWFQIIKIDYIWLWSSANIIFELLLAFFDQHR